MSISKTAVIAIGGNSLILDKKNMSVESQYRAVCTTVKHIVDVIESGYQVIITHGNGPQVGFLLRRSEVANQVENLHGIPLVTCVADTQGGIGYQIQQALKNELAKRNIKGNSVAIITQVVVDANDADFSNPSKPIGEFYTEERAAVLKQENPEWLLKEDAGRGQRRYVPSPSPLEIVEEPSFKILLDAGFHLVAGGGGGIPVLKSNGILKGVDAVIDKDLTSGLMANRLGCGLLVISTAVPYVAINFNTPEQQDLKNITVAEAKQYIESKHFAPGSMLPKILAAIEFLEKGGTEVIITSPENLKDAVLHGLGTHIVP